MSLWTYLQRGSWNHGETTHDTNMMKLKIVIHVIDVIKQYCCFNRLRPIRHQLASSICILYDSSRYFMPRQVAVYVLLVARIVLCMEWMASPSWCQTWFDPICIFSFFFPSIKGAQTITRRCQCYTLFKLFKYKNTTLAIGCLKPRESGESQSHIVGSVSLKYVISPFPI